jgi:hypothetical protein
MIPDPPKGYFLNDFFDSNAKEEEKRREGNPLNLWFPSLEAHWHTKD